MNCGNLLSYRNLSVVLAAGLWFGGATETMAEGKPQPTLRLDMSKTYPQFHLSCQEMGPLFHRTAQGQLVIIRGNFLGKNSALISDDQGRTWKNWDALHTWPKLSYCDVLRRGDELLAFGFREDGFKGTYISWSKDDGQTWAGGVLDCPPQDPGRWGPQVARTLLTSRGRLIIPVDEMFGDEGPGPDRIGTNYSDDGGRSWKRSPVFGPPPPLPDRPEGFGEPACVELADGRIWTVFRARFGHLWQAWSTDGGATWGPPSATTLVSPLSAVNAKRIPGSNTVVTMWDNVTPGTSINWNDSNNLWRPRSPLVYAVSKDNCQTWSQPVVLDLGTAAYPIIYFSGTEMFVGYWEDPDPNAVFGNPNSHLMLVAYDIQSVLRYAGEAPPYTPPPNNAGAAK